MSEPEAIDSYTKAKAVVADVARHRERLEIQQSLRRRRERLAEMRREEREIVGEIRRLTARLESQEGCSQVID